MVGRLASWHEYVSRPSSCADLATSVEAIRTANQRGRFAVVLHLQGLGSIGQNPDLLHRYAPPPSRWLSISHRGKRMRMELAGARVVATHANAAALCASPRNLSDGQIRAVAACRGMIGLCAFPAFVATDRPTIDHLANHAPYVAELVGPRHVGKGLDFFKVDVEAYNFYRYDERVYPKPPWRWPARIEAFADTQNLRDALVRRGFSGVEATGVMEEDLPWASQMGWRS